MRGRGGCRGNGRGRVVRNRSGLSTTISQVMDGPIPASSAANLLVAPANSAFNNADSEAGEAALWDIWNQVVEYVSRTPAHKLDRVVEVLAAVAHLEQPASFEIWHEQATWKQLPLLGPVIREIWNDEQYAGAFNINGFAARLTAAGLVDLSIYAIWTLRSVLEDSAPSQTYDVNENERCKAAAAWFIYAGKAMYAFCKEGKTYDGRAAEQGSNIISKDWNGYNEERWRLWAERLELLHRAVTDEDTREVLIKAIEAIRDISSD